jgi:hypothetical protein
MWPHDSGKCKTRVAAKISLYGLRVAERRLLMRGL